MSKSINTFVQHLNEISKAHEDLVKDFNKLYEASTKAIDDNNIDGYKAKELIVLFDNINRLDKKMADVICEMQKDNLMYNLRNKLNLMCDHIHKKKALG